MHINKKHSDGLHFKSNIRFRVNFNSGVDDGFEPLHSLDVNKIDDFDGLLRAMSKTSFGGRLVGEAADVMYDMYTDKKCFKVLTVSGAMTAGKMSLVICEMIDREFVDAIISTGALMAHGLVEIIASTNSRSIISQ